MSVSEPTRTQRLRDLTALLLGRHFPWGPRRLWRRWNERSRPLAYRNGTRYDALVQDIARRHPRRILEIGTAQGVTAERLVRAALAASPGEAIEYWGFDLFEAMTPERFIAEGAKRAGAHEEVARRLAEVAPERVHVQLIPGDTTVTLPQRGDEMADFDLIFIDGGHSEETVRSDWECCQRLAQESSVVFFDDYPRWGVGAVVDAIDHERWHVEIVEPGDTFASADGPVVSKLARVTPR